MKSKFTNFEDMKHQVEFRLEMEKVADQDGGFYVDGSLKDRFVTIEMVESSSNESDLLHRKSLWFIKNIDSKKRVVYEVLE